MTTPLFPRRGSTYREYALMRLRVATHRLAVAESAVELACATRWVNAWASAVGDLHFARHLGKRMGRKPER